MRKIVLPLEETERSILALQYVKKHFSPRQAEIIIVMSDESVGISATRDEEAVALAVVEHKIKLTAQVLDGYQVITRACIGKAGQAIVKIAREYNADYIVMTKSAQDDMLSMIGRTTEYVLNNAPCSTLIISENRMSKGEYKGLKYKKAQAAVTLRGQIGNKQSECMLPSVDADCIYHFDVTVGKIRFIHAVYNPSTRDWDLPPTDGQDGSVDILAGESTDIAVHANSVDGKADRIRVLNRSMKQEAVFSYKITVAKDSTSQTINVQETLAETPEPEDISPEESRLAAYDSGLVEDKVSREDSIEESNLATIEPDAEEDEVIEKDSVEEITKAVYDEIPMPAVYGVELEPSGAETMQAEQGTEIPKSLDDEINEAIAQLKGSSPFETVERLTADSDVGSLHKKPMDAVIAFDDEGDCEENTEENAEETVEEVVETKDNVSAEPIQESVACEPPVESQNDGELVSNEDVTESSSVGDAGIDLEGYFDSIISKYQAKPVEYSEEVDAYLVENKY